MFLLISALNTVYQFWIHTETIGKLPKPIEFIFNTPSHHRVHHGRDPKYIDKNHAGSLIIWDRLFGTFQEEEEHPTYGITTPINTWNPVWANLQHYVSMVNQLRETSGWMNKWKVVWYKPGWRPEELGGYQAPKVVNKETYTKYNTTSAFHLSIYVLIQFVAILGVTSLFLFTADTMELNQKLAFSVLIIWSVAQFGILFDNKTRWVNLEYLRIIAASTTITYLMDANWVALISGAFALISVFWFFLVRREVPKIEAVKA